MIVLLLSQLRIILLGSRKKRSLSADGPLDSVIILLTSHSRSRGFVSYGGGTVWWVVDGGQNLLCSEFLNTNNNKLTRAFGARWCMAFAVPRREIKVDRLLPTGVGIGSKVNF